MPPASLAALLRVVAQDLEPDDGGRLVVARKVAANRLVNLTDPQVRHGRKSKSQTFEGFKVHMLGDVVSGLLLSLSVTSGNVHDGQPAHRLIRRAKELVASLSRVMGDTAYGGAKLRHVVQKTLDVTLLALLQEVSDDVQVLEHESLSIHRPVMATLRAP